MPEQPLMNVSVIVCTYNPDAGRLAQSINGLRRQTLAMENWELIIVDNNSDNKALATIDLSWHPWAYIMLEPRQGLTYSRIGGFKKATGEIIVMVDDDNVLDKDYLQEMINIFSRYPKLGAAGGKSLPLFTVTPPAWIKEFSNNLALRDLGERILIDEWNNSYPSSAPIGAGMGIRKLALSGYLEKLQAPQALITDRTATSLSSGGDNDIVIEILKSGWSVGYFPGLVLTHIIHANRTTVAYLSKLVHDINKSWVQVLEHHAIYPWKKISRFSLPFRKLKAYFKHRAWRNEASHIRWMGTCGTFEGLTKSRADNRN
jgi:glycosyltransferase involved in cell wall biosynthesis